MKKPLRCPANFPCSDERLSVGAARARARRRSSGWVYYRAAAWTYVKRLPTCPYGAWRAGFGGGLPLSAFASSRLPPASAFASARPLLTSGPTPPAAYGLPLGPLPRPPALTFGRAFGRVRVPASLLRRDARARQVARWITQFAPQK